MITSLLINFVFTILNMLFFFVDPITELPYGAGDTITTVYGFAHYAVRIFPPLGTAMVYFLIGVGIEYLYFSYRVLKAIIEFATQLK